MWLNPTNIRSSNVLVGYLAVSVAARQWTSIVISNLHHPRLRDPSDNSNFCRKCSASWCFIRIIEALEDGSPPAVLTAFGQYFQTNDATTNNGGR